MKTVIEWLEWAEEQGYPWADAAMTNCDLDIETISRNHPTLVSALCDAFTWDESPEGYEFWCKIELELYANGK